MQINIKFLEEERFSAESDNRKIIIDTSQKIPENLTDTEETMNITRGMSPAEIFLASLGACVGVYTVRYCKNADIDTTGLEILVSSDLSKNKPIRFEDIKIKINLSQDIKDRKRALLEFVKNCPVHNTILQKPNVEFSI